MKVDNPKAGHSIFETMKVTAAGIEMPEYHWQRMARGGKILGLQVPAYPAWLNRLGEYLSGISRKTPFALKLSLSPAQWLFSTRDIPYTKKQYREGVHIIFLEGRRQDKIPLTYIKSPDYLDNTPALQQMQDKEAFEGIWLNSRGELMEGTKSNIYFVRKRAVFTPSLASGCLQGTRRRVVRELTHRCKIPFCEQNVFPEDLLLADEIFLTNALMGIMPVSRVERTEISFAAGDRITVALQDAVGQAEK